VPKLLLQGMNSQQQHQVMAHQQQHLVLAAELA
jgi:hypothetical protein